MVIKRSSGINVLTWDEVMELFRDSEEYQKAKHAYLNAYWRNCSQCGLSFKVQPDDHCICSLECELEFNKDDLKYYGGWRGTHCKGCHCSDKDA